MFAHWRCLAVPMLVILWTMIGLQNKARCVFGVFSCLRFSAVRRLLCTAASGLLLGGCASSPAQVGRNVNAEDAAGVRDGRSSVAVPATRGDVPGVGNPAGIQLYTQTADGIYLLVADHSAPSQRGWAGFGGAADAGETIAQTAARETEEETRGAFQRADLLAAIAGQEPVFDGKFAFYFVEVDKVPAEEINLHAINAADVAYAERGPFAWVPLSEIERCLALPASSQPGAYPIDEKHLPAAERSTDWFWPVWLNNFRAAQEQGVLPW